MSEFLSMGGYGKYLWPAFLLGFGIVVLNFWMAVNSLSNARRDAKRRLELQS